MVTRWEYKNVWSRAAELEAKLNDLGADGWEVAGILQVSNTDYPSILLKRPCQ
jgi:hypothetical protein